jgi:transaldolase/glucose-6-phosphate isomerase
MTKRAKTSVERLLERGQSIWLDTISREMLTSGELRRLVREVGIRGVTSNPDIFHKAVTSSNLYDKAIERLALSGHSSLEIYETLAVEDIRKAADLLLPVWRKTKGYDGYVSLEVSPHLAHDAVATIDEGVRLWNAVNRPNLMIKVPATPAGLVAIEELIALGINVNVTLLFSVTTYRAVMEAYCAGLERRAKKGEDLGAVRSVASFFVSRIDTLVDSLLATRVSNLPTTQTSGVGSLFGKAAVACAKLAYAAFQEFFDSKRFQKLSAKGAQVQRPLWASTSAKNPLYSALCYVLSLVGESTINTVPKVTLDSLLQNEAPQVGTIVEDVEGGREVLQQLQALGIDIEAVAAQLLEDGVARFVRSFDALLSAISAKRLAALGHLGAQTENAGSLASTLESVYAATYEARYVPRLWKKDPSLWTSDPAIAEKIVNRLGWLNSPFQMLTFCRDIQRFAEQVKKDGFTHVVLLGMGGSSLCPEVCAKTFGSRAGYPELIVLDNTSPDAVRSVEKRIDLPHTLFIVASKSGTTIETSSFYQYFSDRLIKIGISNFGNHFIAITDPGTPLAELARSQNFRAVFENPPDIGGRFSALSFFGLVPMALIGLDVPALLIRAVAFALDRGAVTIPKADAAVRLGIFMAECARAGRDKLTFVISPPIASFGDWVEQLVAESTGKMGQGILPVVGERLSAPSAYGPDRAFVVMQLADETEDPRIAALEKRGFPVARITLRDELDLGVEFLRWEIATAIAGALAKINPFDEPNVTESKQNTARLLKRFKEEGKLPTPKPQVESRGLHLVFSRAALKSVGAKISKPKDALRALLLATEPPNYVALLAYVHANKKIETKLAALRSAVQKATLCATTVGYGPRYLHSTGQLHKGGPDTGIFVMVVPDVDKDLPVPGEDYTFGTLARAQALGDFQALDEHGRKAVLVLTGTDASAGLDELMALAALKA